MAKTKLKIGLDLDGVVADFSQRFVELADLLYGFDLKAEEQTGWQYEYNGVPLDSRYVDAIWQHIEETPNFWMTLDTLPDSQILTEKALEYNLIFITARGLCKGMSLEDQAANWLRRNYYIPNPQVIVSRDKGKLVNALGLNAFIDDRPENCIDIANNAPNCKVFIHAAPYNTQYVSSYAGITRTKNLPEFFTQLEGGLYGSQKAA